MATQASSSLLALIQQLEQTENLAQRNLWLHDVLQWIRGDRRSVDDAAARVGLLVDALLEGLARACAAAESVMSSSRWVMSSGP